MSTIATAKAPRLRADAVRNRERILAAARESFVLHGLDAPLDEIARRAGVGNATLYRHFPDRKTLLLHVLLHVKQQLVDRAEAAMAAEDDPFETLSALVLSAARERVGGLCPLIAGSLDREDPRLLESQRQMREITERVIARAHASGQLRGDVGAGDLLIAIGRLTLPLPGTCGGSEDMALRHLQIFLDGLRTPARSVLPGSARHFEDLEDELR
ncbi:TetR/AcrR family transcriptional regulator [Streptomyces millisiae]|uniref:Helix-turn-helix domain-containing protein n=1 Tax=Streptomyces millisiae TaxID=3075542 RepID=A0ABU2LQZ7_9ACTN|nr:helix-turn-helix domain-containing protein [Streptomyces sp. DSM 44918]MDT0320012.1 helix-turn-helix domain-containing protein [Streptomyces sp. DSM 44918]